MRVYSHRLVVLTCDLTKALSSLYNVLLLLLLLIIYSYTNITCGLALLVEADVDHLLKGCDWSDGVEYSF
jgi:hypothetical protein